MATLGVTTINIFGFAGNDTITINSLTSGKVLTADGGDDNDSLTVLNAVTIGTTLLGGKGDDTLTGGRGSDFLKGGVGDDTYVFRAATILETDTVTELPNQGVDTLSFATLTTAVNLNLGTTAVQNVHRNRTLKLNSAGTFENAVGGSSDDILTGNAFANTLIGNNGNDNLIGNAGNDQLLGGVGRDILIGGLNQDVLDGGSDDDILIAGRTTSDASITKLIILRTEWIKALPYATRVANLRAGVGSPGTSLKAKVNVLNDANEADTLTGSSGQDWYFKAIDDVIAHSLGSELVDLL